MHDVSRTVVHLLYRFEFGGVQSLLIECIGRSINTPVRHIIVCLADYDAAAAKALGDIEIIALNRHRHGAWHVHAQLFFTLRRLKPDILQTYNLSTIEYAVTGALAGVPLRIHAEHGRGLYERDGNVKKYNYLRRAISPLIAIFITVSSDLTVWLTDTVRVPKQKVRLIRNGIDTHRFFPGNDKREQDNSDQPRDIVIGTVGRLDDIKAHSDLIKAFILLTQQFQDWPVRLSLMIVGEGPLFEKLTQQIRSANIEDSVWMPGARQDIDELMRSMSIYVLPSISEASPVTLLEAMATGLPVVATKVGGIPDIVAEGRGTLVAPSDVEALANAIGEYIRKPLLARLHAAAGRAFVINHFNIESTAAAYAMLYSPADHQVTL